MTSVSIGRLTPERRRELTRTALVEAAGDVFARRGFHAASLEEIAEAAGFTRGAIYSNFENKEDLLLAVFDRYNEILLEAFSGAYDIEDPVERATHTSALWTRLVRQDPNILLLSLELRVYAIRNESFRRRLAEHMRQHVGRMAELMTAEPWAHDENVRAAMEDFVTLGWAGSDGLLQFAAVDREHDDMYDRLAKLLFTLMAQGAEEAVGAPGGETSKSGPSA